MGAYRLATLCAAVVALSVSLLPRPAAARGLSEAVLDELNFARARPAEYADELRQAGRSGGFRYEDPDALDEAIDFLERQRPLPPLRHDERLSQAAAAFAQAQGPGGQVGHGGPGRTSLGQRLQRRGLFAGMSAENISYGYDDPRDVIRQLIVDSGVSSRGHRNNIFSAGYQAAGVGCAAHRVYGAMCVIDFAGAIVSR